MAAFEHEHNNKLKKLQKERVDGKISDAETDYLLQVGSMLKDFYVDQPPTVLVKPQRKPNMKHKAVKKREPSAVEKSQSIQSWAAVQSNQQEGAFLKKYSEAFGTANIASKLQSTDMGLASAEAANDEFCPECNAECLVNHREAALVCTKCGLTRDFIEGSTANLTYDQEMSIATSSNSPYVRENHLNELLAQIQGKETTQVPQHVLDAVKLEYKKDGITSRKKVTPEATLRYLKKLAFSDNHWVRHAPTKFVWNTVVHMGTSVCRGHCHWHQQLACISVLPRIKHYVQEAKQVCNCSPAQFCQCPQALCSATVP